MDFLVFTDQEPPKDSPIAENVHFIQLTVKEFQLRLKKKTGHDHPNARGYKLCDFKPLYGFVFSDFLNEFSRWGYCDEDIFFGRLDKFFTTYLLETHDIISCCRCCIAGPLTIFKNNLKTTALYQQIPKLHELLSSSANRGIDEGLLNDAALKHEATGDLKVLRHQFCAGDVHAKDWELWSNDLELKEYGRLHGPLLHGTARWQEGVVTHIESGREFELFHFRIWKHTWCLPDLGTPPEDILGWVNDVKGLNFERKPHGTTTRTWLCLFLYSCCVFSLKSSRWILGKKSY